MLKLSVTIFVAGLALGVSAAQIEFDFSKDKVDQPPPGFVSLVTGRGEPGPWKVIHEGVPPLLAALEPGAQASTADRAVLSIQSYDLGEEHRPILLFTNEIFDDFTLTTRFKIGGGIIEPSAGLVFRAQDKNNYYVVRASAEGNLLWYKVVNGQAYESIGIGVRLPMAKNVWRELRVECSGSQMRCYLDGKLVIPPVRPGAPTNDVAINDTTFARGMVGFWTKADSQCAFVDGRVRYNPRLPYVQVVVNNVIRQYPSLLGLTVYAIKNGAMPVVIGSMNESDFGKPGTKTEREVIENGGTYFLKDGKAVEITMPLRDRNGDTAAAIKIRMKGFRGETEKTAIVRAVGIRRLFETQIETQDITQ